MNRCHDCAKEHGVLGDPSGESFGQCKRHWVSHLRDLGVYDANAEEVEAMPDDAFPPDMNQNDFKESIQNV